MTFEVVTVTLAGRTFRACRRCVGHVEFTIERLRDEHPDATLNVIQPPWNDAVAASAGTHDKCAVFDVAILGMEWFPAQRFLREQGWAAWYRFPPAFSHHIHMVSLACPGPLGEFVPGQVLDYHSHAFGLAGQHDPGSDRSYFPEDIEATIFDFDLWRDDMPAPKDWDAEDWKAFKEHLEPSIVAGIAAFVVRKKTATQNELTARAAWRQAAEKE